MAKTIKLHGHTYRVMNANTKVAQNFLWSFENSSDVELSDVYGSYSHAKAQAYEYCREREREFSSYNGVITGHNSMVFSYAFTGWCDGRKYLIFITRCHDYAIDITSMDR